MTVQPISADLNSQAQAIRANGILGRSGQTQRLFDYLVDCAAQGKSPKELEIAIDALGRGADFDVSQDALVRVYIHKLRKRLDDYYAGAGVNEHLRIVMPRGEYRLTLAPRAPATDDPIGQPAVHADQGAGVGVGHDPGRAHGPRWVRWALAALLVSLLANVLLTLPRFAQHADPLAAVRRSQLWAPLFDDSMPIYVVAGDYYIFGEMDENQNVKRLIRDFDINSPMEFEYAAQTDPTFADRYHDLNLAYLPTSSAFALRDVMPVLAAAGKRVHVVMASEVTADQLKSGHVIYIGYFSGMASLREIVFAGSRLSTGSNFDELRDNKTGKEYTSNVGLERGRLKYHDYGYISSFPGTNGNQIIIIAGTRDIAAMRAAEIATSSDSLTALTKAEPSSSFEALYEVYGFGSTDLDAKLVVSAPRDPNAIWRNLPAAQ
ncbi:MAG: hypothetical protein ABI616_12180 [Pseudomonadota bacterium]